VERIYKQYIKSGQIDDMGIGRSSGGNEEEAGDVKISQMCVTRRGDNTHLRWNVPIIFVPGVMGTRLHFTNIDERWNPDSRWDMLHWLRISAQRQRQEMHINQPAIVMTDNTNDDLETDENGLGWEGMAWDFYVPFLRFLKNQEFRLALCPIYAVGYDWRQDIGFLGDFLAQRIENIITNKDVLHAVIITHSMGGLVTRAALKAKADIAKKILGVIHVVQPTVGAVVAYRRFFTGAISEIDGGGGLSRILGNTGEKYAAVISGLTGPMQLIPSNLYKNRNNEAWLRYRENGVDKDWKGDVFDLYTNEHSPPGLLEHSLYSRGERLNVKNELMTRISEAKAFHNWIGAYKHENTYAEFSTNVETDMAIMFDPPIPPEDGDWENRGAIPVRRRQGDGTVPDTSASVLFPNQDGDCGGVPEDEVEESPNQCRVNNVEHSAAFNNNRIRGTVVSWINRILFEKVSKRKHI